MAVQEVKVCVCVSVSVSIPKAINYIHVILNVYNKLSYVLKHNETILLIGADSLVTSDTTIIILSQLL